MIVDLRAFEMQNLVATPTGLRTRRGLVSLKTPTSGTQFVAAFSMKNPRTTDTWHYLVEQSTTTNIVTVRCFTEEFFEVWSLPIGAMPANPVVTWAEVNRQVMINSPSFSTPLYGLSGGGMQTASMSTPSLNDDTVALDLMPGHVSQFGDRLVIASGDRAFFNDPGLDPRTFVVENALALPGAVYDVFQGPDRGLYLFTSAGAYTLPQDAIGQGQEVIGFIGHIPGVSTMRPRNACAAAGAVGVLQQDHLLILPSTRVQLFRVGLRRALSDVLDVDDLRRSGELFPTPKGFLVGFRGARGHFAAVDALTQSVSWVTNAEAALNLVGSLTSRDGETLPVTTSNVLAFFSRGPTDPYNAAAVAGVASGIIPVAPDDRPVIRRVTVAADNVAENVVVAVDGDSTTATTSTKTSDNIIGTSTWSASTTFVSRATRSTRVSMRVRSSAPTLEVKIVGADRMVRHEVDVELVGQRRRSRDAS